MEDKIPQSFKVRWLNSTLKFVKNDNQMVMEYPQMPVAYVEYLHNLMWQRQNNVGLGFKSLYAPLWEAMTIYSVKYQFKISATKAESGELGQLRIQKIPIPTNEDCDKLPLKPDIRQMQKSTSPVCEEPIMQQKTKTRNQDCAKVLKSNNEEKVKIKPKKPSDSQKYLVRARKIIDSIAPAFFKTTFQKILDFVNDEASASFTFSDLAPNEAKFLENFLGIYNRRTYFGVFFSPYCNDLLDKICISFKEFDKNSKLDICVGKTDTKTCKREIIFLKVPRYTKNTFSKAKLSNNTTGQLSSENDMDSSSCKFLKALKVKDFSTDHNASTLILNSDSRTIDNTDIETDDEFKFNATDKENVKSMVFNNVNIKDAQNTVSSEKNIDIIEINNKSKMKNTVKAREVFEFEAENTNNIDLDSENEHVNKKKCPNTIDLRTYNDSNKTNNIFTKAIEKIEKKDDKGKSLPESKEKTKIIDNPNINNLFKDIKETKITVNNKKETDITDDNKEKMRSVYLKDNNTKITPQIPKTGIPFAKASERTDNVEVQGKSINAKVIQGSRKHKLLEAMSTPLESDKALRMMRLMGWKGGALGLRGEGIIEPIMPALNIKPGAGLGHVSEKSQKKRGKLSNCLQLLEAILDLTTKDMTESILIIFNSDVTKKEKRNFNAMINLVNMNKNLNLVDKYENDLCLKIYENMADAQFKLDLVHDSNRKFILNKILSTEIKGQKSKKEKKKTTQITTTDLTSESTNVIELPTIKTQFKMLVLTKVLEFQKEKQNLVLNLHFDSILNTRHRKVLEKLCSSVNNKVMMTNKQVPFKNLVVELYQSLDDSFFDITFGLDLKSFTIRKVKEKPGTNAVVKNKNDKTATVDEIQNTLSKISLTESVLRENKTDNAINKQETDKKDSKNGNVKDDNNNYGSKELKPNTDGRPEVSSNSSSPKKYKAYILLVQTKNYKKCPKYIANLITTKIDSEMEFPPYLKSHGVQNGYIVYSCYKKRSYLWLKNLLTDYRVIDYRGMDEMYVLKVKINVNIDCKKVLSLLETYNPGLNSNNWDVLDVNNFNNSVDFLVQLDFNSFEYVRNNNFRLPAGVDDVQFSINIEYYSSYLSCL